MTFIPKAICTACNDVYTPKENGVLVAAYATTLDGPMPYYTIYADTYACRTCGHVIVTGFAAEPSSMEQFGPFAHELSTAKFRVNL